MDQIISQQTRAFRIDFADAALWCLGPGVHSEEIAPEDDFLDIHIGGTMSNWAVKGERGATSACPPNSFTFLPAGEARTVASTRTGSTVRASFRRTELVEAVAGEVPVAPIRHGFDAALLGAACLVRDHIAMCNGAVDPSRARGFVSMLALRLAYLLSDARNAQSLKRPQPIQSALEHIEANLGEPLLHGDIAAVAGVSPYHFARMFRMAMGMSVRKYIISRRLARAQALLLRTNDGLADIAYQVGFGSQSHMTTLFRKHLGRTPGEFRAR